MKKIIAIGICLCLYTYALAQSEPDSKDSTFDLKNLYIPSSPAFNLLDISPASIERPTTAKAFAVSIGNAVGQTQFIPKNYAVEIAPFWFFRHRKMSVFKNFGVEPESIHGKTKQNIFYGLRNTSISIGTVSRDSSKLNPLNVTYLAYSVKSNIINVRPKIVIETLVHANIDINEKLRDENLAAIKACLDIEDDAERQKCKESEIQKRNDTAFKEADSLLELATNIRPVFSLDAAIASSMGFYDNTFSNNNHYRTGGWLTLSFSQALDKGSRYDIAKLANAKNYFNAYALLRILSEDSTADMKTFKRYNYFDYGLRAEFEFNRFSVSFEHVQRKVAHDNSLNSMRNVGIVQYKIDDNLYFTGTFGKNFGEQNNLIAFFGISWGLGKTAVYDKFNRAGSSN